MSDVKASPAEKTYRVANAAALVTALSFLGPIGGLAVEVTLAWRYGASGTVDAFRTAYLLIGFSSNMFVAYLLPHLVVPLLADARARGREKEGWRIILSFGLTVAAGALAIAIFVALKPGLVCDVLGPGLRGAVRAETLMMLRAFGPAGAVVLWCGVISGVLYTYQVFTVTPLCQMICNLALVGAVLILPSQGSFAVTVGVASGFAVMLWLHQSALGRVAARIPIRPVLRPVPWVAIGSLFVRGLPLVALVGTTVAGYAAINNAMSRLPTGNLARYGYASKFMVIVTYASVGLTTVMFPALSEAYARRDEERFARLTARGIRITLLISGAFGGVVFALREPLAQLMFDHGALTGPDMRLVVELIGLLLLQAIPGNLNFFLLKVCFARDDMGWPVFWMCLSNLALCLTLAVSSARAILIFFDCVQWSAALALLIYVVSRYRVVTRRALLSFAGSVAVVSALSTLAASLAYTWLARFGHGFLLNAAAAIVAAGITLPVILLGSRLLGLRETKELEHFAVWWMRKFVPWLRPICYPDSLHEL